MVHLPNAQSHPVVEVVAICDVSTDVLHGVGDRFGIDRRYNSVQTLLNHEAADLNGVLVCTPPYTRLETALPVLERGLPALIEKPLATVPETARKIAAADHDATSMVGYMKRYHPTVTATYDTINEQPTIDLVDVYSIAPDQQTIIQQIHSPLGDPPSGSLPSELRQEIADAIGTDEEWLLDTYMFQLEHACHDINLLRGVFGGVTSIDHVDVFNDGRYLTAHLTYGDIRCILKTGRSDRIWFEQRLRVDTPERRIMIEFDYPFKQHAPPTLEVTDGQEAYNQNSTSCSYRDSFAHELDHFVECIKGGTSPQTPLDEAAADVNLMANIFRTYT